MRWRSERVELRREGGGGKVRVGGRGGNMVLEVVGVGGVGFRREDRVVRVMEPSILPMIMEWVERFIVAMAR